MLKLGVNTVLFKKYSLDEAANIIKRAGYDGMEIAGIVGMCDHLVGDKTTVQAKLIRDIAEKYQLELLSTEAATHDVERLKKVFETCQAAGIPIVNIGTGGKSDDPEEFNKTIETLIQLSELADSYGLILCCKAHVGNSIYNTATTIRVMEAIKNNNFGIDMDPSHIYRANENPEEALPPVISRVKHIHIRDCKGRGPGPGTPADQACGRGDIDLFGYFKAMIAADYQGPVCLEVIGPELDMVEAAIIAAESYGYMKAILRVYV